MMNHHHSMSSTSFLIGGVCIILTGTATATTLMPVYTFGVTEKKKAKKKATSAL
jgi:hypothetical protein